MKLILITIALLLISDQAQAAGVRLRLREHYEIHQIEKNSRSAEYRGFSNTMNLWWEEPFEYAVGLAFSPILGSAKKAQDNLASEFGDKIQLINLGLELKYFHFKSFPGFFSRLGVGWSELKTNGTIKNTSGWNLYTGIGYEYPFKYFSVVPEIAMRNTYLEKTIIITSFTPSIAFHFYNIF